MPKNTLYVTGFTKESKAADLAPEFEKYGELVRLDIPPPRTDDGEKYAFVEYKNEEDCEKALELDGKSLPYAKPGGLVVQVARSDPYNPRRGRGGPRGGFRGGRGYPRGGGYGRGGYGAPPYSAPYPPPRGVRGGYGYGYGYERGGYGYPGPHPYPPPRGGRGDPYYGGGYGYGREPYGYRDRGYNDRGPPPDERDQPYRDRADRYIGERRDESRGRDFERRDHGDGDSTSRSRENSKHPPHESNGTDEFSRGRYSRSASPQRERERSRSRSPSR
ncbi:hypothetical_protein [Candidozyma auris]|uniref:hypothetical_protein n=1 Tax=Candidozyma auris TaxID=498019 RepID=UPI000D283CA6|nr:hypothetical_protein [[Candida] auris]QEO21630.1 hypothetical_protein [[Candida] auris]GBL47869.1 hypothetical protein CAJCM15448_01430 [[Candida] auris]